MGIQRFGKGVSGESRAKRVGIVERSSNDAIRRVMHSDVTLLSGVTVLSQGQPAQGPDPCHHPSLPRHPQPP